MHLANGVEIDERVRSAIISDSLDVIGIRTNVMSRNITPLAPNMKCIGFAATIEFIEDDTFNESDPYGEAIDFLDSLQPEDVAIIATNQSKDLLFGVNCLLQRPKVGAPTGWLLMGHFEIPAKLKR